MLQQRSTFLENGMTWLPFNELIIRIFPPFSLSSQYINQSLIYFCLSVFVIVNDLKNKQTTYSYKLRNSKQNGIIFIVRSLLVQCLWLYTYECHVISVVSSQV